MNSRSDATIPKDGKNIKRRDFILSVVFGTALTLAYGLFGWFSLKFLRPQRLSRMGKMFVGYSEDIPKGGTHAFLTPKGERFLLTRSEQDEYSAFSTRCPHLGCKVNWEADTKRFFCPCHAGVFDASGKGIEGPPKGMTLKSCDIKVEGKALYAMVEP